MGRGELRDAEENGEPICGFRTLMMELPIAAYKVARVSFQYYNYIIWNEKC